MSHRVDDRCQDYGGAGPAGQVDAIRKTRDNGHGMSETKTIPAAISGVAKPPPPHGLERIWRWLQRTPVRTFVLYPAAVVAFELISQGGALRVLPWGVPLLLWGFLQYRIVRSYRGRQGGGGPGLDLPPEHLVGDGPYRYTRNPMYLGHLIFLAGLALTFRSWFALLILIATMIWFHRRVRRDEKHLLQQFGAAYEDYCRRTKRWIPGLI